MPTLRLSQSHLKFLLWNLLWVLLLLVCGEYSLSYLLSHPPQSGDLLTPMREYYVVADRKIVQYLPECAQWDESLGLHLTAWPVSFRESGVFDRHSHK